MNIQQLISCFLLLSVALVSSVMIRATNNPSDSICMSYNIRGDTPVASGDEIVADACDASNNRQMNWVVTYRNNRNGEEIFQMCLEGKSLCAGSEEIDYLSESQSEITIVKLMTKNSAKKGQQWTKDKITGAYINQLTKGCLIHGRSTSGSSLGLMHDLMATVPCDRYIPQQWTVSSHYDEVQDEIIFHPYEKLNEKHNQKLKLKNKMILEN